MQLAWPVGGSDRTRSAKKNATALRSFDARRTCSFAPQAPHTGIIAWSFCRLERLREQKRAESAGFGGREVPIGLGVADCKLKILYFLFAVTLSRQTVSQLSERWPQAPLFFPALLRRKSNKPPNPINTILAGSGTGTVLPLPAFK